MISPLRYPGGKAKLFPFLVELIESNNLYAKTYSEPYAGGAGLALKLLSHGYVPRIELNDIDEAIAAFWRSLLYYPEQFSHLVCETELSVDEWRRQRVIYSHGLQVGELALGFSAYYLNRTSRSGIIEGSGPIGGYLQKGPWFIDARYNARVQVAQIHEIARYADAITVSSLDAMVFCKPRLLSSDHFIYLDPPYYVKGKKLYKNFYEHVDHKRISELLSAHRSARWILTYDCSPEILDLYADFDVRRYVLSYSAGAVGKGQELLYHSDLINLPISSRLQLAA